MRVFDRLFDLYVNLQVQRIVFNRLRPAEAKDPLADDEAKAMLQKALGIVETQIEGRTWIMGEDFSMADCAAAPALFYSAHVMPFGDMYPQAFAYRERLMQRPPYARALKEAEPYFKLFPQGDAA
jgi:glutathione S-transferase